MKSRHTILKGDSKLCLLLSLLLFAQLIVHYLYKAGILPFLQNLTHREQNQVEYFLLFPHNKFCNLFVQTVSISIDK